MVKSLLIVILLFNGNLHLEYFELSRQMDLHECLSFADDHREAIATHSWGKQWGAPDFKLEGIKQGWYLNDGRGTVQGFICQ
jgi:hypothetical protein